MSKSFIYVIAPKDNVEGPVKIGYTKTPEKRLQNLQVGHQDVLHIFHLVEVSDENARVMEAIIHDANRHNKLRGEWYNLSVKNAKAEIDWAFIRFEDEPNLLRKYKINKG